MSQLQLGQYLKYFGLAALCWLILLAGFNWIVDPYGIYNSTRIEGFNALKPEASKVLRMYKAYAVREIKPNSIILGTSTAEIGIDPDNAGWSYKPVYNLALSGSHIYEITRYFQHANSIHPLTQVVLMLDDFNFSINGTSIPNVPGFDESRFSVSYDGQKNLSLNVNDIIDSLGSFDAFLSSWNTIIHQGERDTQHLDNGMDKYPSMLKKVLATDGYRAFLLRDAGKEGVSSSAQILYTETDHSSFDYYRKILQTAYQDDIDLYVAISPSHVWEWELAEADRFTRFEQVKRTLVIINEEEALRAGKSPFPLWDFSGYNEFTTEAVPPLGDTATTMQWYWDTKHYKKELGDLVLNRIFNCPAIEGVSIRDFGMLLTSENIDEYLHEIRADQQLYRNTHPDDIAEIRKLTEKLEAPTK